MLSLIQCTNVSPECECSSSDKKQYLSSPSQHTNVNNCFYAQLIKIFSGLLMCLMCSPVNAGLEGLTKNETKHFEADTFYLALVAEIHQQLGNDQQSVVYYSQLNTRLNNPTVAKRVTELATVTGQMEKALEGAKRWVEIEADSLEANQYLALLYLRNTQYDLAAYQLNQIRQLVEISAITNELDNETLRTEKTIASNESLAFVGAILAAESHHGKSLLVFKRFAQQYFIKVTGAKRYFLQQQLILSNLALKAKRYQEVLDVLDSLGNLDHVLDEKNRVDTVAMKAKALHKLRDNQGAIQQLQDIQNSLEVKDSHRLELVRLLVLEKQKQQALPLLEVLVAKHAKNHELLKSLIALKLDVSQLDNIEMDIKRLSMQKKYRFETFYFRGEYAEKLGLLDKALSYYEQVLKGSYLRNAEKKRIHLTRRLLGDQGVSILFQREQAKAPTIKTQAHWIKLEGDDFFQQKAYQQALSLYQKATRLSPKTWQYLYHRGLAQARLGSVKQAESDFRGVLSIHKKNTKALNAMGYLLSTQTERFNEAKNYLYQAHKLSPNDPLVLENFGVVLFKMGESKIAEKHLRKAYRLNRSPQVASHLISVLAKSNKFDEAQRIYQQMIKQFPKSVRLKEVRHYFQ